MILWRTLFGKFDTEPYDYQGLIETHIDDLAARAVWSGFGRGGRGMKKLAFALMLSLVLGACEEKHDQAWLGYGEGDTAMISAPQAGWVTELKVERGTVVHRGDLLFVLDDTHAAGRPRTGAAAHWTRPRASLAQEQSNLVYAATELMRQDSLARAHAGTPTQRDLAPHQ